MRLRPTRMEVSLSNFRWNYRALREHVKTANVFAVLKANAYGMGAIPAAWALKAEGADLFAVATPDEAVELRESGIDDPVLVLGSSPYDAAETYVKLGVRAAITDVRMAEALSKAAQRQNRPAFIHFKVDTGMGRIGFLPSDALNVAERISKLPGIDFEGVFTHFATSDSGDLAHTHEQFKRFSAIVESIKKMKISVRIVHCCNSGALLAGLSSMYCDAVRPGQILCGIPPSKECGDAVPFKSCFEFKTAVGAIRELPPGTGVTYGLTYTTTETERVAILPVGYADGYNRGLSNKGDVLIRGTRCPVRGRVCMDQCVVGVSHLKEIEVGDEVVLIGSQGNETVSIEEIAAKIPTITPTIPTAITARVPRVYI
ncbi:alanine racemase [Synergistales bacterium]|nr:alanine racemase [Synergistales bacterium]